MICGHQTDFEQLQDDIMALGAWVKKWQMEYFGDKSKVTHMGKTYATACNCAVSDTASASG